MQDFKVIIIGAGLGGLVLAQSLRRANIEFELFERDCSPFDRPQGYRLHLEGDALNAAREVLSPELHRVFERTAQRTAPFTTLLDTSLEVFRRIPTEADSDRSVWPDTPAEDVHCNVDRATLRQLLLTGLDDVCHWNKHLDRYESGAQGVKVFFSDGTSAVGDVLVGADGIRSAVRKQRAPEAQIMDAGIRAIYGRIPLEAARAAVPPAVLTDIFTIAIDARKLFFAMGSVIFPTPPDRAATLAKVDVKLKPQQDYVVCIIGGREELFPRSSSDMRSSPSNELGNAAQVMLGDWPQRATSIVRLADQSAFFFVEMFSSVPFTMDSPTKVTLLGDAIHAMTPTLGRGANLAMRDGALLGRRLKAVARGECPLETALGAYETEMLRYGFTVVRESVQVGQQRAGQNPLP